MCPMDLIALAVPFFILALLAEVAIDRWRGTGYYRLNDAIGSLSAGMLSTTIGLFTRVVNIAIYAFVLDYFAIATLDMALFDFSPAGLAMWAGALLFWDFCYYWVHRFGHEISVMWAAHAVHHQSEEYNLSTALRQTSSGFLLSWVFYLPMFLVGIPVEVFITVNAIDLIYQFWVHTRHVGKLGWADRVFVTPSNHRVHHAQNERYIDKNYGGILILWDRLFGTFQEELDEEPVVYGVRKPLRSWNPFYANLHVYHYLWRDAVRTRRWRDKLGLWFRRTGWRPPDLRDEPRGNVAPEGFEKFDPMLPAAARPYLLGQFVLAVLVSSAIGAVFTTVALPATLVLCLLFWFLVYNLAVLNEGRPSAVRLELVRLLVAVPLGALWLAQTEPGWFAGTAVWPALGGYVALSVTGLVMLPEFGRNATAERAIS